MSGPDRDIQSPTLGDSSFVERDRNAPSAIARGSRIGRYIVQSQLGAGGMGVVYLARDPELDRNVALKLLHPGLSSHGTSLGRARLLREAQAMAKLTHPNVVTVHDVGEHHGAVYLAMELIEGRTLHKWLAGNRALGWSTVLDVFEQAGRGLAAAHDKDLVHRDFKPDNVMVADDPDGARPFGRVLVMDFGLARARGDIASGDLEPRTPLQSTADLLSSPLTVAGSAVGTPAYMAPEQHLRARIDARGDQFAFCVALYEAVFGQRPFAGETAADLVMNVTEGELRAPPSKGPRGRVPPWLRRAIVRGLRVSPDDRWASMDALLQAIADGRRGARRRWIAIAALGVGAIPAIVIGTQQWRAHRDAVRCAAAAADIDSVWNGDVRAAVTAALASAPVADADATSRQVVPWLDGFAHAWRTTRERTCLVAARPEAGEELAARADACLEERRLRLATLLDALVVADAAFVHRAVSAVASLPAVEPCGDPHELALWPPFPTDAHDAATEILTSLGRANAMMAAGRYPDALVAAQQAEQHAVGVGFAPMMAEATRVLGVTHARLGDYERAESLLARAYVDAEVSGAPGVAADAATSLVHVVGIERAHHAEALVWAKAAEAAVVPLEPTPGVRFARHLENLAAVRFAMGSYEDAKALQERSLSIRREALGADHPEVATSMIGLGATLRAMADFDGARTLQQRALELRERAFGAEHPEVASVLSNLASGDLAQGDHDGAVARLRRAMGILERSLGPDHPNVADVLGTLAVAHRGRGEFAEALALHRRALAIRIAAVGPDHPDVGRTLNNLATVHHAMNQPDQEKAALLEALRIWEHAMGPTHPELAAVLVNLAKLHEAHDELLQARRLYERAMSIRTAALGPEHPKLAYVHVGLGNIAVAEHRWADAVPHAERAVALREGGRAPAPELAEAKYLLAQALWSAPQQHGGDRSRAIGLAGEAAAVFRSHDGMAGAAQMVQAWIDGRGASTGR